MLVKQKEKEETISRGDPFVRERPVLELLGTSLHPQETLSHTAPHTLAAMLNNTLTNTFRLKKHNVNRWAIAVGPVQERSERQLLNHHRQ